MSTSKDERKRKADIADEIFCIHAGGYTGTGAGPEIEYAQVIGKPVCHLQETP